MSWLWPKSVTLRGVIITCATTVLVTILVWLLPSKEKAINSQPVTITSPSGISFANQGGTVVINNLIPESDTKKTLAILEQKLADTNSNITVTRDELRLLSNIVKELDQRTSGITKLPDGRTQFGQFVSGQPTIVLENHEKAIELRNQGKTAEALMHSRAAIKAIDDSSKAAPATISTGTIDPANQAKVYYLGAMLAFDSQSFSEARDWAVKAAQLNRKAYFLALAAASEAELGNLTKAKDLLDEARGVDASDEMVGRVGAYLATKR